ncbi:inactive heme oxygenase [Salix suchowensis]|nr:inactive heme oxygenase [Salix suchowensis]
MALLSLSASCKPPSMEPLVHSSSCISLLFPSQLKFPNPIKNKNHKIITCCSNSNSCLPTTATPSVGPPVMKKRKRYRKPYPGENKGITEEMRFVAMKLRNIKGKHTHKTVNSVDGDNDDSSQYSENDSVSEKEEEEEEEEGNDDNDSDSDIWIPSMEGFVKYLVDSKLVFDTLERIVDKSDDVSYAYFRKTGLERSEGLAKDLAWFSQRNIEIPEPSTPGTSYVKYLEELAEDNAPLFLSHFYNIYFSHIAGGQVISRKVSDKLLQGRELEFYRWGGDAQELLKGVREKLNMLGEHWTRDEKNKCLKEAAKSFRYLGQIVRLIIL